MVRLLFPTPMLPITTTFAWTTGCIKQPTQIINILKSVASDVQQFKRFRSMSSQSTSNEILTKIRKIYQTYEEKANQLAEAQREKTGTKIDKSEHQFMSKLTEIEKNINELVLEMRKKQKGASNQFRQNIGPVEDCLRDMRIILKKKSLNFKVSLQIKAIIEETEDALVAIRKDLVIVQETKFLCCGTNGAKKFKTPMNLFKIVAAKWKMMTFFQSKESVENFISPKFSQSQFRFIPDILSKKWPESKVVEVEKEVEVIREVIREVNTGKGSLLGVANEYIYGVNKEQNLMYGLQIYHNEADKNSNVAACSFLGKVYEDGILIPRDVKKAFVYYQKGFNLKDPYSTYRYAMLLIRGLVNPTGQNKDDFEKAFNIFTQLANNENLNCPEVLAELGEIYQFGSFVDDSSSMFVIKKDLKKAINLYLRAKNQNLSRAANNLAVLYLNNKSANEVESIPEVDKKIISLLEDSKAQGFGQAYYNLGVIYSKGLLGERNCEEALRMFYEGGLKGDYKCKIKFAYELMNQTSIMKEEYEDHYHLAIHWLESVTRKIDSEQPAGQNDQAEAIFYLGLFYEHGFGTEKSSRKAFNFFIQSADLEYAAAKNKIGDCYFSGYGIKQDRQLAIGCYLEAAELNSSDAMVNLGTVYLNGISGLVERSYNKAYNFFVKASELENTDAMIHLSYMYRNGLGLEKSQEVAKQLLEQAAELKNATALYMLREQGFDFNEKVLFQHLQNEFPSAPQKIDLKQIIPVIQSHLGKI